MDPDGPRTAHTPVAALFDDAPAAVLVTTGLTIAYANTAAATLLGLSHESLCQLPITELLDTNVRTLQGDGAQLPLYLTSALGTELIAHRTQIAEGTVLTISPRSPHADATESEAPHTPHEPAESLTYEWDPVTDEMQWGGSLQALLGRGQPADQPTMSGWRSRIHPDDRDEVRRAHESIGHEPQARLVYRVRTRGGRYLHVLDHVEASVSADGSPSVSGSVTDLTVQWELEEALRRREHEFEALVSRSPDVVARFDRDLRIAYINAAVSRFNRVRPSDLIGKRFADVALFDDPSVSERWVAVVRRTFETGLEITHTDIVSTELGEFGLQARIVPEYGASGEIESVLAVTRDVTALIRVQEALRESEELSTSLLASIPDCITVLDLTGRLQSVNPPGLVALELDSFELVCGEEWTVLWPSEERSRIRAAVEAAQRGETTSFRAFAPAAKGTLKWWDVVVTPVVSETATPRYILAISRDVTNQHKAEQELRVNEARFRRLWDAQVIGTAFCTLDGAIVDANDAFLALVGRTRAELDAATLTLPAITPPEYAELDAVALTDLRERGSCEPFEKEYVRPDGARVPVLVSAATIPGDIADVVAYIVDLTELKQSERRMREADELLQLALSASEAGLWFYDLRTDEMRWTDEHFTIFGIPPGSRQPSYDLWMRYLHPDDRSWAEAELWRSLQAGDLLAMEYRIVRDDGTVRWVRSTGRSQVDANGLPMRSLGMIVDITERTKAEEERVGALEREREAQTAALAAEARFRLLFEGAADAVLVVDDGGRVIEANPASCDLLGYNEEQLTYLSLDDIAASGSSLTTIANGGVAGEIYQGQMEIRTASGSLAAVEFRARVVRTLDGSPMRYISMRDMSEQRALERMHQELIDSVAHDLKNPLASIKGQAQLVGRRLEKGTLEPDYVRSALENINNGVERMAGQLDELLEVARLRAGTPIDLRRSDVELVELVMRQITELLPPEETQRITVNADGPNVICSLDARRFERVVANLLSNAVKYSPDGRIAVDINREEAERETWVELRVSDQGVGIPAADLPFIFERFRRGSNVDSRTPGTGIGLAGVRQIVHHHGGAITVDSVEGEGTTVTVRLPCEAPA